MARLRLETALVFAAAVALPLLVVWGANDGPAPSVPSAELRLGERLFRDTRFAQSVAAGGPTSHAFACATCHLSGAVETDAGCGVRAFCDFAARTPLPAREDGLKTTVRNTPALQDIALPHTVPGLLHYDGEFQSIESLAAATLTGRSLGWLPGERARAVAHVVRVVRMDDGLDRNALEHGGGAYSTLLASPTLPSELRLDVAVVSDAEVLDGIARVLAHYVQSLSLQPGRADGRVFRSAYDRFLEKNGLPARPNPGETDLDYGRRLRTALLALERPADVGPEDGALRTHAHPFRFGDLERRGLQVFLAEESDEVRLQRTVHRSPKPVGGVSPGGIGSCISCHAPPTFTDGLFHNVGASQAEYDAVHGMGAFARLAVPDLAARNADPVRYLPPSARHPDALGLFLSPPRRDDPRRADLGLWNSFANPDVPVSQRELRKAMKEAEQRAQLFPLRAFFPGPQEAQDADLLPLTVGRMKTPTLRNLGHSAPYFHGGHVRTLEDAVQHYRAVAFSARAGLVRNGANELAQIDLALDDLLSLAAFLRALDEDPP